jgi:outer membrane protein assembly factor BamD (BamD/ComL family)
VDLAAERALIDRARMALARSQSGAALEAVDAHAKSFPRGRLAEEREAIAIQALSQAGRAADARVRADRFRAAYPNSVFGAAVDAVVPPR